MKSETEKFEEAYLLGRCYEICRISYDDDGATDPEHLAAEMSERANISISKSKQMIEWLIKICDICFNNRGHLVIGLKSDETHKKEKQ